MRLGRSLELTAEGDLIVRTYIDVGNPEVMGHAYLWQSEEYRATVGSVQADLMLQDAVGETGRNLEEGLEIFVENLPQRS